MKNAPLFSAKLLRQLKEALQTPVSAEPIEAIDRQLIEAFVPLINWACQKYYRLSVEGLQNVPSGKGLLVGNHNSGVSFYESLGVGARWYLERGTDELIHSLAHDAIIDMPIGNRLLRRIGALRASHESARQAFERGRKVLVFPGGNLEAFRSYKERDRVVFGGRKGFIKLALRAQVPIIPVVFVGGHETFFILNDGKKLARLLRLDKIPILRSNTWPLIASLPFGLSLGPLPHIPLPAKCTTRFLEPISLEGYTPEDAENPEVLEKIYQQVTSTMQQHLSEMYAQRRLPLIG